MYKKVEDYFKEKPVLFWTITTLVVSLTSFLSFSKRIISELEKEYLLNGFQILGFIIVPLIFLAFILFLIKGSNKSIIKELDSIQKRLQNTFEKEGVSYLSKVKTVNRFYNYEILEAIDEYNSIVERLKKKYPIKYKYLNFREEKSKARKGDWIYESEMNFLKMDVEGLLVKLKN